MAGHSKDHALYAALGARRGAAVGMVVTSATVAGRNPE